MRVCRLILRFDFPVNAEIMNSPGTVVQELVAARSHKSKSSKLFSHVQGNSGNEEYWGISISESNDFAQKFSVHPKSMSINLESCEGIAFPDLASDRNFKDLLQLLQHVGNKFNIGNIERAGLRLFIFEDLGDDLARRLKSTVDDALVAPISEHLGISTDVGFAFDRITEDEFSSHLRFGPFLPELELTKYVSQISLESLPGPFNSVFDIDQYEKDIHIVWDQSYQWWKPLAHKAHALIENLGQKLKEIS